jgi:Protein of unknown function (DUF2953)
MGLAVLILLVFCIPLEVTFRIQMAGRPEVEVRVLWGFGLVRKELATKKKPPEKQSRANAKPKPRKREGRTDTMLQILRSKGMLSQLQRMVIDTLRCLRLKELNADIRIGLDDPADTGLLFALIGPAAVFVRSIWHHQIRFMPSFEDEATLEGHAHGTVTVQPIRLIPPFVRFVFSSPTFNVLKVLILNLWKRQK